MFFHMFKRTVAFQPPFFRVYAVSGRVAGFLNRKQYLAVAHSSMLEHIYITVRLTIMHIPIQESRNRDPSFGRIEALRLS